MTEVALQIIETTRRTWEKEMAILTNEQLTELTGGLV